MKIGIIGAGNMGGAIADALIKVGGHEIIISNRSKEKLERFAGKGINVTTDNNEATANSDLIVLAVKPWQMESVVTTITSEVDCSSKTFVSVAAAIHGEQLCQWAGAGPQLFSAIPNTAIAHRASMTFLVPIRADEQTTIQVKAVFDTLGNTFITDESHLFAGTALASCGIAYALSYIRAAAEGGVKLGFGAQDAKDIVMQTMRGALSLLEPEDADVTAEIDKVTTPGGLTFRGLSAMEEAGFTKAVIQGLLASLPTDK